MSRIINIGLLLSAVLLLVLANRPIDKNNHILTVQNKLCSFLTKDSTAIRHYFQSLDNEALLKPIDLSLFDIEVYKNDSIVYWNEKEAVEKLKKPASRLLSVVDSSYKAIFFINYNNINSYFDSALILPSDSGAYSLNFYNIKFRCDVVKANSSELYKTLAWWMMYVCMILYSLSIVRKWITYRYQSEINPVQDSNITRTMVLLLVVLLGFKFLQYIPLFSHLLEGSIMVARSNDYSWLTQSLADLLINNWILGMTIYLIGQSSKKTIFNAINSAKLLYFLCAFTTLFTFGLMVHVIEGFVMTDLINLEIESLLDFDISSVLLIVGLCAMMLLFFQFSYTYFKAIAKIEVSPLIKYGFKTIGWSTGLALLLALGLLNVTVWIFIFFVVAYALILEAYVENEQIKITYLIWWMIMFSGFLATCLFHFGLKKNIAIRTDFLKHYFTPTDPTIVKNLSDFQDTLVNSGVFNKISAMDKTSKLSPIFLKNIIDSATINVNPKLDFNIGLFDRKGTTMFKDHFANFYRTSQTYKNAKLVAKNINHNPFENEYIIRYEVSISTSLNDNWYLYLSHKSSDGQEGAYVQSRLDEIAFVTMYDGQIIDKNEPNQAIPSMELLNTIDTTQIKNDYSFVVFTPDSHYKVISYKKISGLIKPISLFSFVLTICGLIVLLLSLVNTKYEFLPSNLALKFGDRTSLKTKIQLAIILLILLTFVTIGSITGIYFKNLIEATQYAKNSEETTSLLNNIHSDIQNLSDDEAALNFLKSKLKELSFVHNKEIAIYDQSGQLLLSTIKYKNFLRVPYMIWQHNNLHSGDISSIDIMRDVDKGIDFHTIRLNSSKPFAYLCVAHKSINNSAKNILEFLSTILNAYIFLFLIAGAIAITIANSITQPLSILTEKLKKFKLGKTNELLEWKSNDEIGTLINDYNNLTVELHRSANVLAKTERDLAWREMAKQVAHEIKNPLTPMKLSIQYLDRTAKDYPEKSLALIPRISATLIEQIDNLTQIANEFSNFAAMPQASNEKIALNEIVETIHDLFRKRDDMDINMIEPIDDLYVFADKNHLVRILNNLLKNAIQAIPENKRGKIEIELSRQGNEAIIRVSDNGTGIPDDMKDKVFTPNFTTKSSGTGLGLAISVNMIESFNGRIYFETKLNFGTDFYMAIPLMRLDDYLQEENHVMLE